MKNKNIKLQVGDKVICVNKKNNPLSDGRIYIISHISKHGYIKLREFFYDRWFNIIMFKKVD